MYSYRWKYDKKAIKFQLLNCNNVQFKKINFSDKIGNCEQKIAKCGTDFSCIEKAIMECVGKYFFINSKYKEEVANTYSTI